MCRVAFHGQRSVIKSAGWRAVFGEKEDGEDNAHFAACRTEIVYRFPALNYWRNRQAQPLHTESSLLSSMETAGKELKTQN
jgi:DNA topoisomerase-3